MNKKIKGQIITILIPIVLVVLYSVHNTLLNLMWFLPPCPFYMHLDLYCPACGNTRSVTALLRGDLLTSLRYNIVPILLILVGLSAYIELATHSFGRYHKILPRKLSFYLVGISIIMVYMILRNFFPYLTP